MRSSAYGINACERCMRNPALGRKNRLFASSVDGGRAITSWLTVIQSARLHEAEAFAYVSELLKRIAEYRDTPAERKAAEGEALLRGSYRRRGSREIRTSGSRVGGEGLIERLR
jgi:hypothetical protein